MPDKPDSTDQIIKKIYDANFPEPDIENG